MVIDRVSITANVQQAYQGQVKKQAEGGDRKKAADRVEISNAGRYAQIRDEVKARVSEAPSIRQDKVEEARRKLETGELLTDAVIDQIAERIVSNLGI